MKADEQNRTPRDEYRERMREVAGRQGEFEQNPLYLKIDKSTRDELKRRGFLIFAIEPPKHASVSVTISFFRDYYLTDGGRADAYFSVSTPDRLVATWIHEKDDWVTFEGVQLTMPVPPEQTKNGFGIRSERLLDKTKDAEELLDALDRADRMIRTEARAGVAVEIRESAQLVGYYGRIVEIMFDGRLRRCLIASTPRSLADPEQGFTLAFEDDGRPQTSALLANGEFADGPLNISPLDGARAAKTKLADGRRNPFDREDIVAAINAARDEYGGRDSIVASTLALHEDTPDLTRAYAISSLALRLDDEVARRLFALVTPEGASFNRISYQVEKFPGIWTEFDGTWLLAEDVRRELVRYAYKILPVEIINHARRILAEHWESQAREYDEVTPRGQLEIYRSRRGRFEAAYQRTLIPEERQRVTKDWDTLLTSLQGSARTATLKSIAYLANEIAELGGGLPAVLVDAIKEAQERAATYISKELGSSRFPAASILEWAESCGVDLVRNMERLSALEEPARTTFARDIRDRSTKSLEAEKKNDRS